MKTFEYNNNRQKFAALLQWLRNNGVNDFVEHLVDETGLRIDLYLPTQNIAVHISDGHNQVFYKRACVDYRPFFIYSKDTTERVIEKMRNCLDGHTCTTAPKSKKVAESKPDVKHDKQDPRPQIKKRQRIRVSAQRVTPVRK